MADAQTLTNIADINEMIKYMGYLKNSYKWNTQPVGFRIENASTDPKVTRIDRYGDEFDPEPDFFYNHELFRWPKVLLSDAGVETLGSDYIGTGLDLTGASGNVMARVTNGKKKYWYEEDNDIQFYLFATLGSDYQGFDYHPACYMGGGELHDYFYEAVYPAGLKVGTSGALQFNSCSGVQPWTGGQMRAVPFTAGTTEFTVGETITGATSGATGKVVSWYKSSGEWVGNAAGTVYIRNPGVAVSTAIAFASSETLSRTTGSAATNGSQTILTLTIDNALTYAANKGTGWTISDIYSDAWIQGLTYTMLGTRNAQTAVGSGVVNLAANNGYGGLLNGENSINTNINDYGTGVGIGTDGLVSVSFNNIQDKWGQCCEYEAGINLFSANGTDGDGNPYTAGSYRVTKRDGTGTISGTLPAGSYETGLGVLPLSNGYISTIQLDELGAILFLPRAVSASNITNFCDIFYCSVVNPNTIATSGFWNSGLSGGIGYRNATTTSSSSGNITGARLKYIPPIV